MKLFRQSVAAIVLFGVSLFSSCAHSYEAKGRQVRVATFNIQELSQTKLSEVDDHGRGTHTQLKNAARVIQLVRPDILLINEIDFDKNNDVAKTFAERYLYVDQGVSRPIDYPYWFAAEVNTGVPSGLDFDNDGKTDGPADAYGFGRYPGQYGMVIFSQFPIDLKNARTFRNLRWQSMPQNLMPDGQNGKPAWYDKNTAMAMRLSSKSHWDVPILVLGRPLHILASHPTPPVFDGPEDRNGRRNFDEIRFWGDYISEPSPPYIIDDNAQTGGLDAGAVFLIAGDLNARPENDTIYGKPAIAQLLEHPRITDPRPQANGSLNTASFGRVDYVLPDKRLTIRGQGVFSPKASSPLKNLVRGPDRSSDHALVWVDIWWRSPQTQE